MIKDEEQKRADMKAAYTALTSGTVSILKASAVYGRLMWNWQMRVLIAVGLMPVFVRFWWLFLVVGFVLLAVALPIGTVFLFTGLAAGYNDPRASNNFIVPLRSEFDPDDAGKS